MNSSILHPEPDPMHGHASQSRSTRPTILVTFLLTGLLLAPSFAESQVHRYGAGFTAGGSLISELNPGASGDARSLAPEAGAFFGIHMDRWYGDEGRIGLRYQGAYQQPRFDWNPGERKIDALSADIAALFRLIPPGGTANALPYLTFGAGGIWYNLGTGDPTFYAAADAYHDGGSRILPTATFGAGVDVDVPWPWQEAPVRLRAEVADHMAFGSPLRQSSDGSRYGAVHHVRLSLGLYTVLDIRH